MKKKILICGASGFIGRNLFERLSKRPDLEVYGTYWTNRFTSGKNIIQVNLTDPEWTRTVTLGMDVVVNAAAITDGSGAVASDPGKYITDNIRINTNLIENCHNNHVGQFVFLSCSILYPEFNPSPVKESEVDLAKIHPKYWMGARVKLIGEDLCQFYSSLDRTRFTILRHSNIYGPHDKFDVHRGHVFAATIAKILEANEDQTVNIWGRGTEKRDFLHVYDLVDLLEMLLDYGNKYDVINAGSGNLVSVRDLVNKINYFSGKMRPLHYDITKHSINTQIALDSTKAREFGWKPNIDLNDGIRQTIDWYLKNRSAKDGE